MRVEPWELASKPKIWTAWALDAEAAEIEAQEIARDLANFNGQGNDGKKPTKLLGGE